MRRSTRRGVRATVLAGSLCLLVLGGCRPAGAVNAAPAQLPAHHDGFWWMELGAQSAAVACFGPTITTAEGAMRPWSLVIHLPGSDEPLACRQGMVRLADSHPIFSEGGTYRVELRPCDGCTWGDVTSEELLTATVGGLF